MRILVDADACPVRRLIVEAAKARGIPVVLVADHSHRLEDGYSRVILVDQGRESADLKLVNLLRPDDLVVTQDYGVAAVALGKGARALPQSGEEFTGQNMDLLLFQRFLGQKIRRAGGRAGRLHKRTPQEDRAFIQTLEKILAQMQPAPGETCPQPGEKMV